MTQLSLGIQAKIRQKNNKKHALIICFVKSSLFHNCTSFITVSAFPNTHLLQQWVKVAPDIFEACVRRLRLLFQAPGLWSRGERRVGFLHWWRAELSYKHFPPKGRAALEGKIISLVELQLRPNCCRRQVEDMQLIWIFPRCLCILTMMAWCWWYSQASANSFPAG